MRGDLIVGRFVGDLRRIVLSQDGLSVADGPMQLIADGGEALTQGPDGTLYSPQMEEDQVMVHVPLEDPSPDLVIKASWPRRGPYSGGNIFSLYGEKFDEEGPPAVTVDGNPCPLLSYTATKITCTLPACTIPAGFGKADVIVTSGSQSSTLKAGYRYITGPPGWTPPFFV